MFQPSAEEPRKGKLIIVTFKLNSKNSVVQKGLKGTSRPNQLIQNNQESTDWSSLNFLKNYSNLAETVGLVPNVAIPVTYEEKNVESNG